MKCFFCHKKLAPSFKNVTNLERFLSMRKKIVRRDKTNLCARHQRKLAREIKYARFLALIPYISY